MSKNCLLPFAMMFLSLTIFASTDISNVPMVVSNSAQPNIMYLLDNSGSMDWPFVPDSAFFNANYDAAPNAEMNCFKNNAYNGMYYNPNIVYTPGVDSTGASLGNANFNAAPFDGYNVNATYSTDRHGGDNYTTGTVDLSSAFQAFYDDGYWNLCQYTNNSKCEKPGAAYYYVYSGTNPAVPQQNTCYPNSSYTKVLVTSTSGPGGTDERQNFANWFTYYRTRIMTMKSSLGIAFSGLDSKYRVGFSVINGSTFSNIQNFSASARQNWYATLYGIIANGGTPLRTALQNVGEYYRTGSMQTTSGDTIGSATDPIQYSCQQNFTIVSTDGYWNDNFSMSDSTTDWDNTVVTLPAPVTGLTQGNNWPTPYAEGNIANSTLADVAMKYWNSDLRSSMKNNVPTNSLDPATWQHMVTFTIGLGISGTLNYPGDLAALTNGTKQWPVPLSNDVTGVDDLWHAGINGHGGYYSARDPNSIQSSLQSILNDVIGRSSAAAALAVSNPMVTQSDDTSFVSSYNSGTWSGDVQAYPINLSTGVPNTSSPSWTSGAQAQLDALTWSNRYIASYSGTKGVAFSTSGLSTAQLARLNSPVSPPGNSDNSTVIDFLRGDRSNEGTLYRKRTHVLGDAINSAPAYVGVPRTEYSDAGYADFKSKQANRAKMVYVGANDGMLHAFRADTGAEQWAYVPGVLINTNDNSYTNTSSLLNLTSLNNFSHMYYVDGTPVSLDVDLSNTQGVDAKASPSWATILVGGLNGGGRGYYALNITNPAATSDADVASKVMWEFPNANTTVAPAPGSGKTSANPLTTGISSLKNIGLTFGKPVIVKAPGVGWVVLVTSGYNNGSDTGGDGHGRLFVLNAATGALIADIDTGVGTSSNPAGLAQIAAYSAETNIDNTIDFAYGGDLLGNVWRFNLTGGVPANWSVQLLANLVDSNGTPQPVTSAPEIGMVNAASAAIGSATGSQTRLIFVGTGQYLGSSDISGAINANSHAGQTQSFYALSDNLKPSPTITSIRTHLVQQQLTVAPDGVSISDANNAVDLSSKSGWFVDFPTAGERVVTDPMLARGVMAFTTDVPSTDVCSPGGTSNQYFLNEATGGLVPGQTYAGSQLGSALSSSPELIELPNGTIIVLVRQSDGTIKTTTLPGNGQRPTAVRVSWRELLNQ